MNSRRLKLTAPQRKALELAVSHFTDEYQEEPRGLPCPLSIHPPPDTRDKLMAAIIQDAKVLGKGISNLASRNAIQKKLERIKAWAGKAQSTWAGITPDMLLLLSGAGGSPTDEVKHLAYLGFILRRVQELCQISLDNLPPGTGRRTNSVPISTSGHPSYRDPITHTCERWWLVWNHWVDVPEVTNPNNQRLRANRASGYEAFMVNFLELAQSLVKHKIPISLASLRKRAWPVHTRMMALHSRIESIAKADFSPINVEISGLMPWDRIDLEIFLKSRGIIRDDDELGCS